MKLPSHTSPLAPARSDEANSKEAAKQLEAFFLRRMLAEMRSSQTDGLFSGGYAGKMFQDMLDEAIADQMSESGDIGVAKLMERDFGGALSKGQGDAQPVSLTRPPSEQVASVRRATQAYRVSRAQPIEDADVEDARWNRAASSLRTLPVDAPQSSDFGRRIHPVTGERSFHEGVDLAAPLGSAVKASAPGVVVRAERAGSYGNLVVVDHGGGLETRYAHLQDISVDVGTQLATGEVLGSVGATGRATGPHLHFEVRRGGKAVDPEREFQNLKKSTDLAQDRGKSVDR